MKPLAFTAKDSSECLISQKDKTDSLPFCGRKKITRYKHCTPQKIPRFTGQQFWQCF